MCWLVSWLVGWLAGFRAYCSFSCDEGGGGEVFHEHRADGLAFLEDVLVDFESRLVGFGIKSSHRIFERAEISVDAFMQCRKFFEFIAEEWTRRFSEGIHDGMHFAADTLHALQNILVCRNGLKETITADSSLL